MKTQIQFNIDSTEITEQITAAITAEMKSMGREVANKAFADALETKMKAILDRLDNDIQRYLVFLWSIGVQILTWNNALFDHERAPELRWISDEDWSRAHDGILTLTTSGAF